MKKESIPIIVFPILVLLISIVHIVGLALFFPCLLTVLCVVVLLSFLTRYFVQQPNFGEQYNKDIFFTGTAYLMFAIILFFLAKNFSLNASRFGHWDAWWFWNYRAKFYTNSYLWNSINMPSVGKNLVAAPLAHADYPPGLSSSVAFFWSKFNTQSMIVPYTLAMVFAFAIPLLIFTELFHKNLLVAFIVTFLFFSINEHYITYATTLIADIWVSFFLLAVIVSWDNYRIQHSQYPLLLLGLCLGGLVWSKNEGLLLSSLFIVFNAKTLFNKKVFQYWSIGFFIPLILLLVFKKNYAPNGDLFAESKITMFNKLVDFERYKLIWNYFIAEIKLNHNNLKWIFIVYSLSLIYWKKLPKKNLFILVCALISYFMIYAISPHNLDWHLSTSIDRIVWQFIPAFVYLFLSHVLENTNPPSLVKRNYFSY